MKKQTISLGLSLLAWASLSACNKADNTNVFDQSSTDGTSPADAALGFSLHVGSGSGIDSILHPFNKFGLDCKITSDQTFTDMKCLYNIREQDLYSNGLSYTINVPASMCNYLHEIPYYYYSYEPGRGASNIGVSVGPAGITGCTADGMAGMVVNGVCTFAEGSYSTTGGAACAYNYTSPSDPSGRNCCVGTYNLSVTTTTGGAMPTSSTVSSSNDWGGKFSACMAGPGMGAQYAKVVGGTLDGFPSAPMTPVPSTGLSKVVKVEAPIVAAKGSGFNMFAANFFNWPSYQALTWSDNPATTPRPRAVLPGTDRNGSSVPSGHEAYEFRCLDQSGEILHRIRLYVNEWDSDNAYALYLSSNGTQGSPISTGVVGGSGADDCSGAIPSSPCDTYNSWKDTHYMTFYPFHPY
jgi:hypothetical protein